MEGIASEVVFPERGAMIATATSSYPIRTSCRVPWRLPSRIPASAASMRLESLRLGRSERALSAVAFAIRGWTSRALAIPVIFLRPPPLLLCRDHRTAARVPRTSRTTTGTIRAPISRAVSPRRGQSLSGWRRAVLGWYGAQLPPVRRAVVLPPSQARLDRGTAMARTPRRRRKGMS